MSEQDNQTPQNEAPSEEDALVETLREDAPAENDNEADDLEEVEIGPERLKVIKPMKAAWDGMQRAHTERSEKISAKEREFETREKEIQERVKVVQSFPREIAKVTQLQEQIEAYQKVDWAKLRMSGEVVQVDGRDVPIADYHRGLYENATFQLSQAAGDLKGKIDAEQAKRDGAFAQQKQAYHNEMAAKVKDWSPSKDAELREYAVKNGAPKEVVESIYHPALMLLAQKAMTLDRAMEKAKAAQAKSKQDNEQPLEPPKGLKTGNSSPKRTLENARTPEEYQKIRLKEMADNAASRTTFIRRH